MRPVLDAPSAITDLKTRPHTLLPEAAGEVPELAPGRRLGPYRLTRLLGRGGMGQVWLARQLEPVERDVAIKLQGEQLGGGLSRAYFLVERQALAQMRHPYIAQLYDAGTLEDGSLFFAMEYVAGATLDDWIAQAKPRIGAIVELLIQVCEAIAHAHGRGLIHRDLKPGNILVVDAGLRVVPKIIDFGIALGVDAQTGGARSDGAGTTIYMAPEQARREGGLDQRVDVYALGVITGAAALYRATGDQALFLTESSVLRARLAEPHAPRPHAALPADLRAIVLRATAPDRELRYPSAAALAEDLRRFLQRRPVTAVGDGWRYRFGCFLRRNALASALAALALSATALGGMLATRGYLEARQQRAVAEQRRAQADDLIAFLLGDLADRLRPIGRLELLESVSERALRHLTGPMAEVLDPDDGLKLARSLRILAEVLAARGDFAQSREASLRAVDILTGFESALAHDGEYWFERGQAAFWLGNAARREHDPAGAEAHWRAYAAAAARMAELAPSPRARKERAHASNNLAVLAFERGEYRLAAQEFAATIALESESPPTDVEGLLSLAQAHSWLASAETRSHRLSAAVAAYEKQLAHAEQALALDPLLGDSRYQVAVARHWLARTGLDQGDLDRASAQVAAAEALTGDLVAFDASQAGWWQLHASTLMLRAEIDYWRGDRAAAGAGVDRLAAVLALESGVPAAARSRLDMRRRLLAWRLHAADVDLVALHAEAAALGVEAARPLWRESALMLATTKPRVERTALLAPHLRIDEASAPLEDLGWLSRARRLLGEADAAESLRQRLAALGYAHPSLTEDLAR